MADSGKWEKQIEELKEIREKKQQGIDIDIENVNFPHSRRTLSFAKTEEKEDPYVRKITLEELINETKTKKGEKITAPEKKTPFLDSEKEKKTPVLSKGANQM